MQNRFERLAAGYRFVAFQLLAIVLLVGALNLAALPILWMAERADRRAPGSLAYGIETLRTVYPEYDEVEVRELLRETWTHQYVYRPFIQHKERARSGRYVNTHSAGFREVADQGPWPPPEDSPTVFVFGGSTTFGYGVADLETIPSRLQEALRRSCDSQIRVYNFGGGNFYSVQERVLFEQLLTAGHVPRAAIFIDGINEWKEAPKFTARLEYLMAEPPRRLAYRALRELPLARLLRRFSPNRDQGGLSSASRGDPAEAARPIVDRWVRNLRLTEAAARAADVRTVQVWQPAPFYGYDLDHHPFVDGSVPPGWAERVAAAGYAELDRRRTARELPAAGRMLWLAEMQRDRAEPFYVDRVHYTAAFSREIAALIAATLTEVLDCGNPAADGAARSRPGPVEPYSEGLPVAGFARVVR